MATRQPYELSPLQVTVGGNATAIWGALTNSEVAVFIGIIATLLGFAMNVYFKYDSRKREVEKTKFDKELQLLQLKRDQEIHEAKLKQIRNENA